MLTEVIGRSLGGQNTWVLTFCKLGKHHSVNFIWHIERHVHKNSMHVVHNVHNYSNFWSLPRRTKAGEVTIQGSGIDGLYALFRQLQRAASDAL